MKPRLLCIVLVSASLAACGRDEVPDTHSVLSELSLVASDTVLQVDARVLSEATVSEVSIEYALRSDFTSYASCRVPIDEDARFGASVSPLIPDTTWFVRFRLHNPVGWMLIDSCCEVRTQPLSDDGSGGNDAVDDGLGGHAAVDMGTGVLWAECNVGADQPWDFGDWFAWGEVEPKTEYNYETYRYWSEAEHRHTKYNAADGLRQLEPSDDAAAVQWGHGWRMPTLEEFNQLVEASSLTATSRGMVFTSLVTGAELVFPYASRYTNGCYDATMKAYLWTSIVDEYEVEAATYTIFNQSGTPIAAELLFTRPNGQSVRAVHER